MRKLLLLTVGTPLFASLFFLGAVPGLAAGWPVETVKTIEPSGKLSSLPPDTPWLTSTQAYTIYLPLVGDLRNSKKGLGVVASPACTDMDNLGASWYFNWGVRPDSTCPASYDKRFVPRISGAGSMSYLTVAVQNAQASGWLMGFNEPNLPWQGDVSPAQAAVLWKQIEEAVEGTNIKLVSPSPSQHNPGQLDSYGYTWLWAMVSAYQVQNNGQKPRFDAIAWHIYDANPSTVRAYLTARHNEMLAWGYDVPIWVLEYAGECWSNTGNGVVMTNITPWFNQTPWIGRYAWFANRLYNQFSFWSSCSLVNEAGSLTTLGNIYQGY